MIQPAAHAWLPIETVARPQVRHLLEDAVSAWSKAWFTSRHLAITAVRPIPGVVQPRADRPVFGATTAIGYSARAIARLLDWALDTRLDEVAVLAADQEVLDGFERAMMEDLAARIEAAIEAPNADAVTLATPAGGLETTIGDEAAGDLITFTLSLAALLPAIRGSLPPPARRFPLAAMGDAIEASSLSVEALLGHADIRLSDLDGLAPGDVLVLQTRLDAGVGLSLTGSSSTLGRGSLTDIDGHRAVALEQ